LNRVAAVTKTPVAVFISGRGSNMEKLVEAAREPTHPARICGVLSDTPDAPGLMFARSAGIPAAAVPRAGHAGKAAHEAAIEAQLSAWGARFVALAGFMRVLSPAFTQRWAGRIINIHPSLLPRHKGLDTHARALAEGDQEHGCTVHWVTAELDAGGIIAQSRLAIVEGDTVETLAARVLKLEHALYPAALAQALTQGARLR
jgi:formyltetrahydrofolate-dependent phosphoribosylglycinamide formyltransferase